MNAIAVQSTIRKEEESRKTVSLTATSGVTRSLMVTLLCNGNSDHQKSKGLAQKKMKMYKHRYTTK